jgi:manganese-dependent inorganic pyrophosphatase
MIKVFGHKSPDTDSTCTPIAYVWYLNEIEKQEAEAFVLGDPNREAKFVLDHLKVNLPERLDSLAEGDKVVIIDTNNPEELPDNLEEVQIIEIIDHHKLTGKLSTSEPVSITFRPIACTATIVWQKIKAKNAQVPKEIAGLLLAAILSDTLKFTSPTTTDEDKRAADELAKLAELKPDEFADKMFEAKSDLTGMSPKDILLTDSKIFELGNKKVRISVLETTKPVNAIELKSSLIAEMSELKTTEKLDLIFFFVVDILESSATLLVPGEEEKGVAEKAFNANLDDGTAVLPGVVSRKKQIIPNLEKALS